MGLDLGAWRAKFARETGLTSILQSSGDVKVLCLQRFVRLFGYGASYLILVHFLTSHGFSDARVGLFMTMTVLGDAVISLLLTTITDNVGRRRVLAVGATLMSCSGIVFATMSNYWILLLASVVGVISPSGSEIGPFRTVEESILAQLTPKEIRSDVFAWYTMIGTAGAALGTLLSGWTIQILKSKDGWTSEGAYRVVFAVYATLGLIKLALNFGLSTAVEAEGFGRLKDEEAETNETQALLSNESSSRDVSRAAATPTQNDPLLVRLWAMVPRVSAESRSILIRLLMLFTVDSFASGLASPSWLTYFFTTFHSLEPSTLGTLFLITNLLATVSNLAALPIARRLGPLKTMVFTHFPSAIFLAVLAIPPASTGGTWLAMAFLALRSCTQTMDQAPRQAFLAAAMLPSERTAVLGVVNIVKTLAQAGGLTSSGILSGKSLWLVMFGGAGLLKASYDLMLLGMFLGLKDREDAATE